MASAPDGYQLAKLSEVAGNGLVLLFVLSHWEDQNVYH